MRETKMKSGRKWYETHEWKWLCGVMEGNDDRSQKK
jgi:hypothetical protein